MCGLLDLLQRCAPWIALGGSSCSVGLLTALRVGLLLAEIGHFSAWPALLGGVVARALAWRHLRPAQLWQAGFSVQDDGHVASGWLKRLRLAAVAGLVAGAFLYGYVRPRLTVDGRVLGVFARLYPHLREADWLVLSAGSRAGRAAPPSAVGLHPMAAGHPVA